MSFSRARASALLVSLVVGTSPSLGQDEIRVGDARTALPGVARVPMQLPVSPRLTAAVDAGYGLIESQRDEGAHHRMLGTLGVGFVPLSWLQFGMLGALRYDRHPNDGAGNDSGTIGQFSVLSRVGTGLGGSMRIGADLAATFPGSEKPVESLSSPALDLRGLLGWLPNSGARVAGVAGFRYDRTSRVGSDAPRYRPGDRLALGVSDFNAVLIGVGVVIPVGRTELLGETTADLLIGSGAPSVLKSPIRVDLGLRHALTNRLWAEVLSEVSPSARPDVSPGAALAPIEPRFSISLGLRYRLWDTVPIVANTNGPPVNPPVAPTPSVAPSAIDTPPPQAAIPAVSRAVVTVFDSLGHPLSDAVVKLATDSGEVPLEFQSGSTFSAESVPVGRARLTVSAELMRDWERDVEIDPGKGLELKIEMIAAEMTGQIRGLVRGFDGRPLPANVHIEPGNRDERAGSDGSFNIDVPPGKYRVRVQLGGYQPQERIVAVGKSGVMVLNVDLQKDR